MSIEIRPVTEGDISGYHALLDEVAREGRYLAMTEAPPLDQTAAFIKGILDRGDVMMLATDGERIVGWCDILPGLRATMAHAATLGIGLAGTHRNRGLGGRLLAASIAAARLRGVSRIQLFVFCDNLRARKLYERHGFVLEGTRRRVVRIGDSYLDDHVMALVD